MDMGNYSEKVVLVTGATGLMGSHLVKKIMEVQSAKVIALSRSENKLKEIFHEYAGNDNFRIIAQDAAKPLPSDIDKVDYIFHAASPIAGSTIKNNPVDVIEPNILGTKHYLDFLKKQKQDSGIDGTLVLFSSATVYANIGKEDKVVSESDTSIADALDAPNSPYSESKRIVEILAKAYYKQFGVKSVIARFSYIYGFSYFQPNTAFYEFINKAARGEMITLNNSDIPRRDNIYVDDAVNGVLTIATDGVPGESYNISTNGDLGNFAAVDEMASVISSIVNEIKGSSVGVEYLLQKVDKRKPGIRLDNSKIKTLGWNVEYSLEDGIRETIVEMLKNKEA